MENEDHPYILSDLVQKKDLNWENINLNVLDHQVIQEMSYISHARSIEKAMPEGFNTLNALFDKCWKNISLESRSLILDKEGENSEIAKVFLMGKIALAQQYTAEIIGHLPFERAYDVLENKENEKYFDLLIDGSEISIKNIAEKCNEEEEAVRILFRECSELGIVEFRRHGTEWRYFMTGFAKSVYKKGS